MLSLRDHFHLGAPVPVLTAPALLAGALLALTACQAHPAEERPAPNTLLRGEVRDSWTRGLADADAADEPFWQTFEDELLNALVAEALEHNHDLVASAEMMRAAAARSSIARAARLPQLDANAGYLRQKNVFVGFPIPGSSGPLTNQFSQWTASLNLAWELDLWGKLAASQNAADREFEATYADLLGARLSVAAEVANAWFGLREANDQRELARETLDTYSQSLELVRARNDAGLVGSLDVSLAEANVATSRADLVSAERSLAVASRQIEVLLGRFPAAEIDAAGEFGPLPPPVPVGIPADVLERRPDLFAAERRVAAAESAAKAARLDRWPSVVLTSSFGRTSDQLDDLLDGDFTIWSLASQLVGPILDGGRRRARVDETLAMLLATRAAFAATALRAFFEVENALDAERLVRERIGHLEDAVNAATESTRLATAQYTEGLVAIDLVLESQRRELAAQSSLLAARRELYQARVDLHVALGGGFGPVAEDADGAVEREGLPYGESDEGTSPSVEP